MVELRAGDLLQRRDDVSLAAARPRTRASASGCAVVLVGHVEHRTGQSYSSRSSSNHFMKVKQPVYESSSRSGGGSTVAGRADVALLHHAEVALHVGADVLGVAGVLGLADVLGALAAHPRLQGVDLRGDRGAGRTSAGARSGCRGRRCRRPSARLPWRGESFSKWPAIIAFWRSSWRPWGPPRAEP